MHGVGIPTDIAVHRDHGRGAHATDEPPPNLSGSQAKKRFLSFCQIPPYASDMGATHVTVAVINPADPQKRWEGLFLVDTGSIDCMAPAKQLRAIGILPQSKRTYELADGSEIKLETGTASVEFMGDIVGVTIIFGEDDIEPILGLTALESVGIEVDPKNQRLKRLPAVRLKAVT
jgi:clan AA aspartic protease